MKSNRKRAILKSLCKQFRCDVVELGMYNMLNSNLIWNKTFFIENDVGIFINADSKTIQDENRVRAYRLNNHDVFTLVGIGEFEYYDGLFYAVEFDGYELEIEGIGINPKWKRKSNAYSTEELNTLIQKENE